MAEDTQVPAIHPRSGEGRQITPDLVRRVAEQVYAMLLAETCLERERRGGLGAELTRPPVWRGGR